VNLDRKYFKSDLNYQGFSKLHPKMQEVAKFAIETALSLGVAEPVITETLTTSEIDKALGRVSVSHQQGRAIDLRTWNMADQQIEDLYGTMKAQYGHLGAWTKVGLRQLVVYHDIGKGPHFHIQLDRTFAVDFSKPIGEAGKV
jgi:hypothetical protein